MEELIKKIKALNNSLKDVRASIKPKGMPELGDKGFDVSPVSKETPSAPAPKGPQSKKDPVKVAAQIKNADAKSLMMDQAKQNQSKLNINRRGQWSLKKARDPFSDFPSKQPESAVDKKSREITDKMRERAAAPKKLINEVKGGKPDPAYDKIVSHLFGEEKERNDEIKFDLAHSNGEHHRWEDHFEPEDGHKSTHKFDIPSKEEIEKRLGGSLSDHVRNLDHLENLDNGDEYDTHVETLREKAWG